MRQFSKESKMRIGNQAIFYDNVLLEMNLQPARTFLEFSNHFKECLEGTQNFLNSLGRYYLKAIASVDFPIEELEDVEAKIFGCEPEYCIYKKSDGKIMRVAPPVMTDDNTFRSCGGHIHIGHVVANWELGGKPDKVIKLMDGLVGIVSVLIDKSPESLKRRQIYGGAGSHRITFYGVEYRTPSNFWLKDPALSKLIYKLTRLALEYMITNPEFIDNYIEEPALERIINTANQKQAQVLYNDYSKRLPFEIQEAIDKWQAVIDAYNKDIGYSRPMENWRNVSLKTAA